MPNFHWHYIQSYLALAKAQSKLRALIRFVGRTDYKSESDDEAIITQLDEIEKHLKSVRQTINYGEFSPED